MPGPIEFQTAVAASVGSGTVARYLPRRAHPMVGAWCLLDVFDDDTGVATGVGPHPHTGIQTLTWLAEGESTHRDSLENTSTVGAGDLSLMTAGGGIAHAEEPPGPTSGPIRGAQLWIALPEEARAVAPSYEHLARLERHRDGDVSLVCFHGTFAGLTAPGRTFSPILGAAVDLAQGCHFTFGIERHFEHAVIALSGEVAVAGSPIAPGSAAIVPPGSTHLELSSAPGAEVLVLGGTPFEEPIVMWWNFVARGHEEIAEARADWEAHRRFGEVAGSSLARIEAPQLPNATLRPRPANRSRPA